MTIETLSGTTVCPLRAGRIVTRNLRPGGRFVSMATARIMIVEDNRTTSAIIKGMLEGMDFEVAGVAASGEEAIRTAEEQRPDLILMDIVLQGDLDGIETAAQIHARLGIPVIYLTSEDKEHTVQRAKHTEPYGYLLKPFRQRDLYTAIEMALHRHRLEKQLKEHEQWLETILRSIGDAVVVTDSSGTVTYLNPVAEALTGQTQGAGIGKSSEESFALTHREDGKPVEDPVARVIRTGSSVGSGNYTLVTPDRGDVPIETGASPIPDEQGNLSGVVMVFRDVTDRWRAEKALRESRANLERRVLERTKELRAANLRLETEIRNRERADRTLRESEDLYRDLVEYSQYLILTHDLDGRILSTNLGGASYLGYEPKDFLKKNVRDLLPSDVRHHFGSYLDAVKKAGASHGLMTVQTASGDRRVWEFHNTLRTEGVTTPVVRSMSHDVTEHLRAERAVQRLSKENAAMAEIGRIVSSTLDIHDVYVQFAAAVRKLISFDRIAIRTANHDGSSATIAYAWGPEVPGRNPGDVVFSSGPLHEEIIANRAGVIISLEDEKGISESYPCLLNVFQAGFRSMITVPLFLKDSLIGLLDIQSFEPRAHREKDVRLAEKVGYQIVGALANSQLYSEITRRTKELEKAYEELKELDRLKDSFLSCVSHELRTPLTSIRSFSEILSSLDELGARDRKEFADIINSESERLTQLIDDILDLTKIASGEADWHDAALSMEEIVKEVTISHAPLLKEKDLRLCTDIQAELLPVSADRDRIRQTLVNLLSNAIKFSHEGGEIRIRAETFRGQRQGDSPEWIKVSVSDQGIGIPEKDFETIFARFGQGSADTLTDKPKGVGLGLAICKDIISHYGGNIWVESREGIGSTFHFALPASGHAASALGCDALSAEGGRFQGAPNPLRSG